MRTSQRIRVLKGLSKEGAGARTEFRVGPDPRGPAKCLRCHQPFRVGESWKRLTSPPDPKFGRTASEFTYGVASRYEIKWSRVLFSRPRLGFDVRIQERLERSESSFRYESQIALTSQRR